MTTLSERSGAAPPVAEPCAQKSAAERAALLLAALRARGLSGATSCKLTKNRAVMVSLSGCVLRVHESFADAPTPVLDAIVTFFATRRPEKRAAAKAVILAHAAPRPAPQRRRRRRSSPDAAVEAELAFAHQELNERHFEGRLAPLQPHVSRRMKSRLGHYAPANAAAGSAAEIVISARHIRREGFPRALDTLLHEMVHQWQDENGLKIDHGRDFRRKAREVGTSPFARRPRHLSLSP